MKNILTQKEISKRLSSKSEVQSIPVGTSVMTTVDCMQLDVDEELKDHPFQ